MENNDTYFRQAIFINTAFPGKSSLKKAVIHLV